MAESVEHESDSMITCTAMVPYESNSTTEELLLPNASDSVVGNSGRTLEACAKRASVGFTGGVITAVGLVMIPAPTPFGCVVAAYGVSILATEFDGVSEAMENGKLKLEGNLASLAGKLQDNMNLHDERFRGVYQNVNISSEDGEEAGQSPVVGIAEGEDEETEEEGKYSEFQSVLTKKQNVVAKAKGVWSVHTKNMRRVSIHVIKEVFLPALKNIKFSNPGEGKDEGDDSQTTEGTQEEADSEVSGSDQSVVSNSATEDTNSLQTQPLIMKEEEDGGISLLSESVSSQGKPLASKEEEHTSQDSSAQIEPQITDQEETLLGGSQGILNSESRSSNAEPLKQKQIGRTREVSLVAECNGSQSKPQITEEEDQTSQIYSEGFEGLD